MAHQRLTSAAIAALSIVIALGASVPSASAETAPPGFAIESHSRDVLRYETFTYDTATAVGVSDAAAAAIDATIAKSVNASVRRAVKASYKCLGGGACGVYEGTLTPVPCIGGYLCIRNYVDGYAPGAATSYKEVDAFVFDPTTGARVTITDEVTPAGMSAFINTVRNRVKAFQKRNDFYEPSLLDLIKAPEIQHWAPTARGIRIWFDKYVAAPGFVGVVSLVVPYPSTALIKP